jgi:hypothetical protein
MKKVKILFKYEELARKKPFLHERKGGKESNARRQKS